MRSESFIVNTDAWLLVLCLLLLMLLMVYAGRKIGLKRNWHPENNAGTVVSAIFGLMAFLLAFTFGMSGSRYDTRRENIVSEANAIGTAIMYADLYPEEHRKEFRQDFKMYLEDRIQYFDQAITSESGPKVDYGKKLWRNRLVCYYWICVLTCVIIFITLDLDRPRRGLIRLSASERAMTDLRKMF
jgi:hypothetical protein